MLYIRSLIFTTLAGLLIPVFVIPGMLLYPFPYSVRYSFLSLWAKTVVKLLGLICNLHYEVEGKENIPKHDAAIIFAKHQSAWETIALQAIFPPQTWVLKRELLWVPFFGWALSMLKSIGIDRKAGRKAVFQIAKDGKERLDQGIWIVIFPEGTRVAPGKRKRYGIGGAVLAEKSGHAVVPVAHNAGEYWRRRDLIKHPGVIRVVIGPPIDTVGKTATEINQAAETFIESQMERITTLKGVYTEMVEQQGDQEK